MSERGYIYIHIYKNYKYGSQCPRSQHDTVMVTAVLPGAGQNDALWQLAVTPSQSLLDAGLPWGMRSGSRRRTDT